MQPEDFFRLAGRWLKAHPDKQFRHGLSLHIMDVSTDEGGGFRADTNGGCAWGDTISDAIQAAYDHLRDARSKHSRLHGPHAGHATDDPTWGARRIRYDYRKQDWAEDK